MTDKLWIPLLAIILLLVVMTNDISFFDPVVKHSQIKKECLNSN